MAGDPRGDAEQAQAEAFGFPASGLVAGQGDHLGPRGALAGELDQGAPDAVLIEPVQREIGQAGVFGGPYPVFAACAAAVPQFQVGDLSASSVGGECGQSQAVSVGEPQLGSRVRAFLSDDDAHPGRPAGQGDQARELGDPRPVAHAAVDQIPEQAWTPAYDSAGGVRDGAWVAELTGLIPLAGWPPGMRVIIRKERPHPGAQLRFTDRNGLRLTAFATNTARGQVPDLELRHRRRARCEDRIRAAKDTGLANLPLHGFDQNRIWCALVQLACELTAWTQMITLAGHQARRWEPKRLRLRLFSVAARITRHARRTRLPLSATAPWSELLVTATAKLQPG